MYYSFISFNLRKFAKFLMPILKAQVSFPSNLASIFSTIKHNSSVLFFSSNIIYFGQRSQLNCKFFRFSSAQVKIRRIPQVSSSSNFASFFIVMTHNSSVNFKLVHVLLWTKGSHQSPNFDTFECSGENLPNVSCHFPNRKSVFLQILHQSSGS